MTFSSIKITIHQDMLSGFVATVSQSSRAEGETARGHCAGGSASVRGGRSSIPSEGLERTESVFRF